MKRIWAQPSLSRDFALLSSGILFVLFLITVWVTYSSYQSYTQRINLHLEHESSRIERAFDKEMKAAGYLLMALGKQFTNDEKRDLTDMARTLKSYDNRDSLYSILAWISPDAKVLVSSNVGVLEKPVDISDRDYAQAAELEPWTMVVGQPIEGRVSEHWIIPVAMGLTDNTGRFIGTVMVSVDIDMFSRQMRGTIKRDYMNFALLTRSDHISLFEITDDNLPIDKELLLDKTTDLSFEEQLTHIDRMPWNIRYYPRFSELAGYPYTLLVTYDAHRSDESFTDMLLSRLIQLCIMGIFLLMVLWVMRIRMIRPVLDMTDIAASVARGESYEPLGRAGPVEIESLALQIKRVSDYIQENKRIEDELRNKAFILKDAKDKADMHRRSKSEFLAYICQELRTPLNNVIGFAQVMRDEIYGPIENRKYRQYTADIYETSNKMLEYLQELMVVSKLETGYVLLNEKPVDLHELIRKVLRFTVDKIQSANTHIKVEIPEPFPRFQCDEFRLLEALINLLTHMIEYNKNDHLGIHLHAHLLTEDKDQTCMVLSLYSAGAQPYSTTELRHMVNAHIGRSQFHKPNEAIEDSTSLNLELARTLIELHGGFMCSEDKDGRNSRHIIVLPGSRIVYSDA